MAEVKTKKKGRPKKEISKRAFEELCKIQCTEEEICAVLDVDEATLIKWCKENYDGKVFSKVFAEKRLGGKTSLRRKQWKLASSNASMAIFLGKQYLNQKDNVDVEVNQEALEKLDDVLGKLGGVI